MSMSHRDGTDSETNRKPVVFIDETLPVISCKEVVQKDPVLVFLIAIIDQLFLFIIGIR